MKYSQNMRNSRSPSRRPRAAGPAGALTLLEMVIALAIMVIVFAAVLPQFRNIQNSWSSRQGATEALQNGRVLIGHMSRNLSKAARIKAVSDPTITDGYIEFEATDANAITYRYEVSSNRNVQFGPVGSLSELAGPVNQFQFTCYSLDDLDNPTMDVDQIRSVKIQATVVNSASLGRDQTFATQLYLEANVNMAETDIIIPDSQFRVDSLNGQKPAVIKIDDAHYLCTYTGLTNDGCAVVLTVDVDAGTITCGTLYEFNSNNAVDTALSKIDDTHYLCTYTGDQGNGWAVILTVNTGTWTITEEEGSFEFDSNEANVTALARIDDEHHLCSYSDEWGNCQAVVLTVNKSFWTITKETPLQYAAGTDPALLWVKNSSYLCAYKGTGDGRVVILTVDTGDWTISSSAVCTFSLSGGGWPDLCRLDDRYYLCAYTSSINTGWVIILEVDDWMAVSTKGSAFEFGPGQGRCPALAEINNESSIITWDSVSDYGVVAVLSVDTPTGTIAINGGRFDYSMMTLRPELAHVQGQIYLGVYQGNGGNWAVLFDTVGPIRP